MGTPVVVFGAFDRHNVGDLMFPHLARSLLPHDELILAGLASRDLRPFGGHRVHSLAEVAAAVGERPVRVLQLGGELLTCTAWQAAVMLLPPEQVQPTVAWLGRRPATRRRWVREALGRADRAPYLLARDALPNVARIVVAGVGGVDLGRCAPAMRAEVLAKLRGADAVGVRDARTLAALRAAGIAASPIPDPAVMTRALCGSPIARRARRGDAAAVRAAFPGGYLAVQLSAAFGADATLDALAQALAAVTAARGLGVALFRAGAAPWHDDLDVLRRLASRLPGPRVRVFGSLHPWDVCALVAGAQAVCASSLHARIVALAYACPRVSVKPPGEPAQARKLAAFVEAWDTALGPPVDVDALATALTGALGIPRETLERVACDAERAWSATWPTLAAALAQDSGSQISLRRRNQGVIGPL